jgi:hypothetical protein
MQAQLSTHLSFAQNGQRELTDSVDQRQQPGCQPSPIVPQLLLPLLRFDQPLPGQVRHRVPALLHAAGR